MDIRGFFGNKQIKNEENLKRKATSSVKMKDLSSKTRKLTTAPGIENKDPLTSKSSDFLYKNVVDTFSQIEATKKRLEIQALLIELFQSNLEANTTKEDKIQGLTNIVYLCVNKIAPDFHGIELGVGEGLLIKSLVKATGRDKNAIKDKYDEEGDLGKVAEAFKGSQTSIFGHKPKPLTVQKVIDNFKSLAEVSSQDQKTKMIDKMLVSATPAEAKFLVRSLQGKLRIGLAEQTVLISLARLFSLEHGKGPNRESKALAVDRVKNVFCQLPVYEELISALIETDGTKTLEEYCSVKAGIPLKPMLAKPTTGISVIFDRFAEVDFTCEYKYDGERAQIHMMGSGEVAIYSRNSENHTGKYPDIVPVMKQIQEGTQINSFILDSEVVAYDETEGKLLPFQKLTTRKRKDVTVDNIKVKVIICAFDLLYFNGESLLEKSLSERREILRSNFKEIEHKFVFAKSLDSNLQKHNEDETELTDFLTKAVTDNCEGLMVKTLQDTYEPSKRSLNWLKLKKDYMHGLADSFDLVPIGAFFGKGKRTGKYGSFILASYNDQDYTYESITKIGTGFSDEFLTEVTERLGKTVVKEKPTNYLCDLSPDVWFEPTEVWEVKAADLSISPVYKSAIGLVNDSKGIALRFPRFIRIRDDKSVEQATNREQVADMYRQQNLHTTASDNESLY